MKKKTLLLSAIALIGLATSSFAQSETTDSLVSISPNPADTLTTKAFTATFTFSSAVTCDSVYIVSGDNVRSYAVTDAASTTVSVDVAESDWSSDVTAGLNMLSVSLTGVISVNGDTINYSSGEAGVVMTSFRTLATAAATAEYVGVDQDPYWILAQDLVDFPITFTFTDEVTFGNPDAVAVVSYYNANDSLIDIKEIPDYDMQIGWISRTNYYGLAFCIPAPTDWTPIKYVTISLQEILSNGVEVVLPSPIRFETSFDEEEPVNAENHQNAKVVEGVQTMEGVSISNKADKSTVNSLKPGLYIINGKKVFIK